LPSTALAFETVKVITELLIYDEYGTKDDVVDK
jgi:hypothetical protein